MGIKIGSLTRERREGKAVLTYDNEGGALTQEIRISFLKPTEALLRGINALGKQYEELGEKGEDAEKSLRVAQLLHVDIQSPDIENDEDGTVHRITEADLRALDVMQLQQLWEGVNEHFFLQTPESKSETSTSSTSEPAAA